MSYLRTSRVKSYTATVVVVLHMVRLVVLLAVALALTFAPLASGDFRLSSQDDVEDLDMLGIGSLPLRRLMQGECLLALSMTEGVGVTRRKLQTPGTAEEHKRQETPTSDLIGGCRCRCRKLNRVPRPSHSTLWHA